MRGLLARSGLATLAVACAVLVADGQIFSQPKTDAYMPSLSSFEQALALPQYAPAIFGRQVLSLRSGNLGVVPDPYSGCYRSTGFLELLTTG